MTEPNTQVTASPVSAFTTFGKGAPAAPAAPAGAPAQPIDTLTPIANQFQALSETAFKYFQGVQQREDQEALTIAEREAQNLEIEELAKLRKDNALNYASLVDKGLMDATENPWAEVGAKRGLAKLNARMTKAEINSNLALDFEKNTNELQSAADPVAAMSAYIQSKLNPLGLDEATINDYYYASNFEKEFGQVLESATNSLVKLRLEKGRSDSLEALRNDVVDALAGGPETDPALVGILGEGPSKTERVELLLSDYRYRGHLGNETHERVVGSYLLELAKDGDIDADQVLKEARLSNGKRLFDTMKGQYEIESSVIKAAQRRVRDAGYSVRKDEVVNNTKDFLISRFADGLGTTDTDIGDLVAATGMGDRIERSTDGWVVKVPNVDGTDDEIKLNIDTLQKEGARQRFLRDQQEIVEQLSSEGVDPVNAMLTATVKSAATADRFFNYVHPEIQQGFTDSLGAIDAIMSDPTKALDEDGNASPMVQTAMNGLMLYRRMLGEEGLVRAYLKTDEVQMFYLLDLMEQGSQGPLGVFSDVQVPSGIVPAISRMQGVTPESLKRYPEELKDFNEYMFDNLPSRLKGDMGLIEKMSVLGETVVSLQKLDGTKVAKDILNNFIVTGKNYVYSTLTGPPISDPKVLLQQTVEFAANMNNKVAEDSIAAEIRAIADEHMLPGENKSDWILKNIHFVEDKGKAGALELAGEGGSPWGSRLYSTQDLRKEVNLRTGEISRQNQSKRQKETKTETDDPAKDSAAAAFVEGVSTTLGGGVPFHGTEKVANSVDRVMDWIRKFEAPPTTGGGGSNRQFNP